MNTASLIKILAQAVAPTPDWEQERDAVLRTWHSRHTGNRSRVLELLRKALAPTPEWEAQRTRIIKNIRHSKEHARAVRKAKLSKRPKVKLVEVSRLLPGSKFRLKSEPGIYVLRRDRKITLDGWNLTKAIRPTTKVRLISAAQPRKPGPGWLRAGMIPNGQLVRREGDEQVYGIVWTTKGARLTAAGIEIPITRSTWLLPERRHHNPLQTNA